MSANSILSTFVVLLIAAATLEGQESGSIAGQVTDPAAAAVTSAAVTIRSETTGASFSAISDQTGFYRVPQLAPGTYSITVALTGFRTLKLEGVTVRVNDRLRIDLHLEVGQVNETLTVTGQAPVVNTATSQVSTAYNKEWVQDAPVRRSPILI